MAAPSLLLQGSTTVDAATFTTAAVAPAADRTLLLFVIGGANNAANTVKPSNITGLDLTWEESATVLLDYVRATLYTARTGPTAPTPGAVTITHPSTLQACHWHVLEADAAPALPQSPATYQGTDQNPRYSLTAPPSADSVAVQMAVMNSNTATFSAISGYTVVGSPQSTDATNMRSTVMVADPAVQSSGFNTTAAVPRKVGVTIELAPATVAAPPFAWRMTPQGLAPLYLRGLTPRQIGAGTPPADAGTYTDAYAGTY